MHALNDTELGINLQSMRTRCFEPQNQHQSFFILNHNNDNDNTNIKMKPTLMSIFLSVTLASATPLLDNHISARDALPACSPDMFGKPCSIDLDGVLVPGTCNRITDVSNSQSNAKEPP
jgi:hypothetical protein